MLWVKLEVTSAHRFVNLQSPDDRSRRPEDCSFAGSTVEIAHPKWLLEHLSCYERAMETVGLYRAQNQARPFLLKTGYFKEEKGALHFEASPLLWVFSGA